MKFVLASQRYPENLKSWYLKSFKSMQKTEKTPELLRLKGYTSSFMKFHLPSHYAVQDFYFGLALVSIWGLECLLAFGFISYTLGVHVLV